jgi:hypothetical protein
MLWLNLLPALIVAYYVIDHRARRLCQPVGVAARQAPAAP